MVLTHGYVAFGSFLFPRRTKWCLKQVPDDSSSKGKRAEKKRKYLGSGIPGGCFGLRQKCQIRVYASEEATPRTIRQFLLFLTYRMARPFA